MAGYGFLQFSTLFVGQFLHGKVSGSMNMSLSLAKYLDMPRE